MSLFERIPPQPIAQPKRRQTTCQIGYYHGGLLSVHKLNQAKLGDTTGRLVAKYSPDSVNERKLVPIEEIKFGDQVWAFNLSTMKWEPKHVLETFRTVYDGDIVALTQVPQLVEK